MLELVKSEITTDNEKSFKVKYLKGNALLEFIDSTLYLGLIGFDKNAKDAVTALEGIKNSAQNGPVPLECLAAYILETPEGELEGIVTVEDDEDGEEYLKWIVIKQSLEGKGIGTWLVRQVISDMFRRNIHSVYTCAVDDAALSIFQKLGFSGGDDWMQQKQLAQSTG